MSDVWGSPDPAARKEVEPSPAATPAERTADTPARVEDTERAQAVRHLKQRRDFFSTLGGWASVSAITTGIWVAGGADGYFWPIWPMIGIGIGVVGQAASTWGPMKKDITEADIAAEMRKRELRGH
ncbi:MULTISPECIES: 2TM domain-containing protein [unclassified Rathayibacter]|uniref:2TM domain-containing protein n=1 Tax=unclassified Rathayibacter TaxID=2609250 RepID=UPI0006F73671|nr:MULTISPECIES: 2TM domain-containing protein [unclassified Rathayibacter]KQQ03949.1 hypothetical protein ASF42_10895 [Rathayibacter sp. Leaf294]KQS12403.1 hypothetical protein ASG06_10895 [Rathayibacter sp. Leaf185]